MIDPRTIADRLFGPWRPVPGPPCACSRCRGATPPASRDGMAHDRASHAEWFGRWKLAQMEPQ